MEKHVVWNRERAHLNFSRLVRVSVFLCWKLEAEFHVSSSKVKRFYIRFTDVQWGPNWGMVRLQMLTFVMPSHLFLMFLIVSGPFLLPWPLYQSPIPPKSTLPGQSMSYFFPSKFSYPAFHSLGTKWQPSSLRKKFSEDCWHVYELWLSILFS